MAGLPGSFPSAWSAQVNEKIRGGWLRAAGQSPRSLCLITAAGTGLASRGLMLSYRSKSLFVFAHSNVHVESFASQPTP